MTAGKACGKACGKDGSGGKFHRSVFLTELDFHLKKGFDNIYVLDSPLAYYSKTLGITIQVPTGFETDLASVPRVPFIYSFWGGKCHREAVLHDYVFRTDSIPILPFSMSNKLFLEAMESRGKSRFVRYPMYYGVCIGGYGSYHKRKVDFKFKRRD